MFVIARKKPLVEEHGDVKECNQNSIGGNIGSIHDLHPNQTTKQPNYFLSYMKHTAILKKELESIIQEIQFITDKYRDEVRIFWWDKNAEF